MESKEEQHIAEPQGPASLKHFTHEALHDVLHFDTKLFKTLKPLLFKPGYLTQKTFSADQSKYVKPLGLFVFLNFLFFVFKSKGLFRYYLPEYTPTDYFREAITNKMAELHLSPALFAERFNTAMRFEQKEYLIILVPLFALLVHLLFLFKRRYYIEHLTFSLHFFSFFIVFLMVFPYCMLGIMYLIEHAGYNSSFLDTDKALTGLISPIIFAYLYISLKKVYRNGWFLNAIKAGVLSTSVYLLLVYVYRIALFFIVMHSISE